MLSKLYIVYGASTLWGVWYQFFIKTRCSCLAERLQVPHSDVLLSGASEVKFSCRMASLLSLIDSRSYFDLAVLSRALPLVERRIYVVGFNVGDGSLADCSLTQLAQCYDITAGYQPQLDVVPLLPVAGWTIGELRFAVHLCSREFRRFISHGAVQVA